MNILSSGYSSLRSTKNLNALIKADVVACSPLMPLVKTVKMSRMMSLNDHVPVFCGFT